MSRRRQPYRATYCRKCRRLIAYTVHDGRLPCAWEEWRWEQRSLAQRQAKRNRQARLDCSRLPGRYLRLQAAKRSEAEAARLAALQEVLPLCQ